MINARIQNAIDNGYEVHIGEYISKGWELFKQNAGAFIGITAIFFVLSMFVAFIPFIGSIASGLILSPAYLAGMYLVANKLHKGENTEFNDFFKGFDFIGQLALAALIKMMIGLVAMIPFMITFGFSLFLGFSNGGDLPEFSSLTILLLLIGVGAALYILIAFAWAYHFIIFNKMEFWPALDTSRRLISKRWGSIFLMYLVFGLVMMLGVLALFIGLVVTIPLIYIAEYVAFADVTGLLAEQTTESDIVDHLVD